MSKYTPAMEARLMATAPLNLAKAQSLASEFGSVTYRSVIAKAKQLGIEYESKAPAAKKPQGVTKESLCALIGDAFGLTELQAQGLKAAKLESLQALLDSK
jgi:hypothetical protein